MRSPSSPQHLAVLSFLGQLLAGVLLACSILSAQPMSSASASVLPTDRVGGIPTSRTVEYARQAPNFAAPAGILISMDGRELWSRAADQRRAMASTTKIMTAIVVLERDNLDDVVTVSARATAVGESGAGIRAGQRYTVRQLLQAMLTKSANEAAFALAEYSAGTAESFVVLMNEKAQHLGLTSTHFTNPHGLDAPGHYTSPRDLAALALHAMADPTFRGIVGQSSVVLPHIGRLENTNLLLGRYPGATGIKTGWTNDAGYCVVASATRGSQSFIAVVLGASSDPLRFSEARRLLDFGFAHYRSQALSSQGETLGAPAVGDYLDVTVPALVGETTSAPVLDLEGPVTRRVALPATVDAPIAAGQRLGTVTYVQGDRLLAQVPIVAARAVPEPTMWQRVRIGFIRGWRGVVHALGFRK